MILMFYQPVRHNILTTKLTWRVVISSLSSSLSNVWGNKWTFCPQSWGFEWVWLKSGHDVIWVRAPSEQQLLWVPVTMNIRCAMGRRQAETSMTVWVMFCWVPVLHVDVWHVPSTWVLLQTMFTFPWKQDPCCLWNLSAGWFILTQSRNASGGAQQPVWGVDLASKS